MYSGYRLVYNGTPWVDKMDYTSSDTALRVIGPTARRGFDTPNKVVFVFFFCAYRFGARNPNRIIERWIPCNLYFFRSLAENNDNKKNDDVQLHDVSSKVHTAELSSGFGKKKKKNKNYATRIAGR